MIEIIKIFKRQNGSASVLGIGTMFFLSIIIAGLFPMITTQIKASSANRDLVEAQFAAEAGAKRAIVAMGNARTDWNSWTNVQNYFVDNDASKYYVVKITDSKGTVLTNTAPVVGEVYTITSDGYVNNKHKTVVAKVTKSSQLGVYKYAAFSNGTLFVNSGSGQTKITGDVASNSTINLNWSPSGMITGYAYNPSGTVTAGNGVTKVTAGDAQKIADQGKIDIAGMTPAMPTFTMTGTNLQSTWTSGQWGNHTYQLTDSNYYYNGDYNLNGHSYTIPDGQTVTLYVNGAFNLMAGSKITGGSLIVYAKNGIVFSGGSIQAGNQGTVKLYTPGSLIDHSNSYINASEVDVLAQTSVTMDGGAINSTLSGAVTKIYTKDFTLNNMASIASGNGVGLVVASNNIDITSGKAATTIMIAGNNITGYANNNTIVDGLYANNGISITSIIVQNDPQVAAALASSLNPGASGGQGAALSVLSWNNQ